MGAFELFVNANLGIRKPLITDVGHPSESTKAAGIIGSHYIDSETNFLYEKTGENNVEDWVFLRELGYSLDQETKELSEDVMLDAVVFGQDAYKDVLNLIIELAEEAAKEEDKKE